jgi:hypothetical protein
MCLPSISAVEDESFKIAVLTFRLDLNDAHCILRVSGVVSLGYCTSTSSFLYPNFHRLTQDVLLISFKC